MKKYVNRVFLELISPSDIAYVLTLIKNGKGVWDTDVRMAANSHGGGEKKLHPLFTIGKGKKRLFGKSVWTREGLECFYMVERNWKKVYKRTKLFSRVCSEWEHWEPADEKLKDPVRKHWMEDDKVDKLGEEGGDEKEWWDKDGEEKYTSECDPVDWDWDDEVQEREIGYTGKKKRVIGNIPDREEEGGVGDVEQQKNKEDTGDEPYNKEQGDKEKGNSDDGKSKLQTWTLVRTKK